MQNSDTDEPHETDTSTVTRKQAMELLASVPMRPKRKLTLHDHLYAVVTILMSLASGLLALSGYPWWAIIPTVIAIMSSTIWVSNRQARPNEPRFKAATIITIAFTTWMVLPVWRGLTQGETIPFPEAWIFASVAPAAWLVFYIVLLIRR